jgi:hypothetical protein
MKRLIFLAALMPVAAMAQGFTQHDIAGSFDGSRDMTICTQGYCRSLWRDENTKSEGNGAAKPTYLTGELGVECDRSGCSLPAANAPAANRAAEAAARQLGGFGQPHFGYSADCIPGITWCDSVPPSASTGDGWAQDIIKTPHPPTGDADLDRALAICDAHLKLRRGEMKSGWTDGSPWQSSYSSSCGAVERLWQYPAASKAAAEHAAKEAADKTWLDHYVQTKETSK